MIALQRITKIHFLLLGVILLNMAGRSIFGWSLSHPIVLAIKAIVYLSGAILFFFYVLPFRKIALYFSFYVITPLSVFLLFIFHGIFLGLIASLFLAPVYPIETKYEKESVRAYERFQGFLGACCGYNVSERKFLLFEKTIGVLYLEGPLDSINDEIKIEGDSIYVVSPRRR